jgi:hypothetical protein
VGDASRFNHMAKQAEIGQVESHGTACLRNSRSQI